LVSWSFSLRGHVRASDHGLCAPIVTNGRKSYGKQLLYGIGKTLSYTLIGALFGACGSVVAFTPYALYKLIQFHGSKRFFF
jgi:sulfite exporter TauE/SafE